MRRRHPENLLQFNKNEEKQILAAARARTDPPFVDFRSDAEPRRGAEADRPLGIPNTHPGSGSSGLVVPLTFERALCSHYNLINQLQLVRLDRV